jgi:pimeloyl-ACP methyl ester carboxylesterase
MTPTAETIELSNRIKLPYVPRRRSIVNRSSIFPIAALVLAFASAPERAAWGQDSSQERTLPINGIKMHYQILGEGPPLVLLHWFGACGAIWQPHLDRLSRHYRLIVPDLRGHGRSSNPAGEFTHRQAAHDIFALLDHLGIQRFKAMGISSGGMTLIHMATQQPGRVEAMVLIGATTHFPEQARAIMRRSAPDSLTAQEQEEWGRCSSRGNAQTHEVLLQFHRMKDSYDDMNFTEPYLSTITARTLIVHGDRDEFFPVDIAADMYRAIPRSALWIVPNGGHIPILGALAPVFQDEALAFLGTERTLR